MSSEASTSPPGESTLRMTALTLLSSSARLSCALIKSTILWPPGSTVRLVIIPSTSTTAILSLASLSSVMTSSSLGPAARICLPLVYNKLPTRLLKFPNMLIASNTSNTMAKIIHPRPRREGGVGAGGTITGGGIGGIGGGGGGGG